MAEPEDHAFTWRLRVHGHSQQETATRGLFKVCPANTLSCDPGNVPGDV